MSESRAQPSLSVIVPVHNAGAHLLPCLESLFSQTLENLEVIAVDDCSTDCSSEILESLGRREARLRYVRFEKNRGVSAARNAGLELALGEFVAFVDADDFVDSDAYNSLLDAARVEEVELVACGIQIVDTNGSSIKDVPFPLPNGVRYSRSEVFGFLHNAFELGMLWYPVRSVYSRDLVNRHAIHFDEELRKGEDSLFNLHAMFYADGLTSVGACYYHYRKHEASVTASGLKNESLNIERLAHGFKEFHLTNGFDNRARLDFDRQLLRSDLPMALVRLRGNAGVREEVLELMKSPPIQEAFASVSLWSLGVPWRVLAILLLFRAGAIGILIPLLRASAVLGRAGNNSRLGYRKHRGAGFPRRGK